MLFYFIYVFVAPILLPLLFFLSFFSKKLKIRRNLTWKSIGVAKQGILKNRNGRKVIIFHAASTGEFEQLVPILKLVKRDQFYIILSFFSPTVYLKMNQTSLADGVCFHPYDLIIYSFLFFKKLNPNQYVVVRHDIWPTHILMAKLFQVKTTLINANLYSESLRLKSPFILFNRWVFKNFNQILTPSYRIAKNFNKLLPHSEIIVTGDSRFDQMLFRKKNNKQPSIFSDTNGVKTIIFGSINESDYDIIFQALKQFFPKGDASLKEKKIKLIVVPHEVDHKTIDEIVCMLKGLNMEPTLHSQNNKSKVNVAIVDSIGILADLYKHCDLAYIGGGFGKDKIFGQSGVHSVIEPCAYELITCYGPNIKILDEAIEMVEEGIGFVIQNSSEMISCFTMLGNEIKALQLKQKMKDYLSLKLGSSVKISNYIT